MATLALLWPKAVLLGRWAWRYRLLLAIIWVIGVYTVQFTALSIPQAQAAYTIANSARFNNDDSAYLNRTLTTPTSSNKWTWSAWVKPGNLTITRNLFTAGAAGADDAIALGSSDNLDVYFNIGTNGRRISTAVFRDPSHWYHVVVATDTTQGTAANRLRMYVDGVELTSFGTDTAFTQNYTTKINSAVATYMGQRGNSTQYFDGYMSDVYFVDGQALAPTDFGETDANGYWRPKSYAGTYGTNGFKLDFASGSDLGNDVSGNNNDWTANNINATDQVIDTPTNGFATGNPLIVPAGGTYSNGNLQNTGTARGTFLMTTGKWYWEVYANGASVTAGVISETGTASTTSIASGSTYGFLYDADSKILYYATTTSSFTQFATAYSGNQFPYVTGGSTIVNYGQSANATSTATTLTYRSGSGGYFLYQPTTVSGSGSQTFTGNGTFTVPTYASLTATVNGGGGGGGGGGGSNFCGISARGTAGTAGGASSFNSTVVGNGGGAGGGSGVGICGDSIGAGGAGGTASGGDTNTSGSAGGAGQSAASGGAGGSAGSPRGGAGGAGGNGNGDGGGGGGGGATATKTYSAGGLTVGAGISVVVGGGGGGGSGSNGGGAAGTSGTAGSVAITWTTSASISDYKALSISNLPEPAIVVPKDYFDAVLYTGNASTNAITGLSFQPDFVWAKGRSSAVSHRLIDSVRGGTKVLYSDSTASEAGIGDSNMTFTSTGFTWNGGSTNANDNGVTYVAWAWKESPTSGFDIVTYTGNGANRTIAHSLGVAPDFIIVKIRSSADNWPVYNEALGAGNRLHLNLSNASDASPTTWNGTAPTATNFSVGSASETNLNGGNFVAYLFAEVEGYSKFGSYTGNASTDGPFVYTGFKPRYVMYKRTNVAGEHWTVFDSARNPYNLANRSLYLSSNAADADASTNAPIDLLSNGFKLRNTNSVGNASGGTYIYAAFADVPFKYSAAEAAAAEASNAGATFLMGMEF